MKKKIIGMFAIVALFALAVAAYAYTRTNTVTAADKSCCSKSADSCPMKGKSHDGNADHAKMSCCEKHKGDHAKPDGQHAKGEGHACCECCGDSCPMKKDGAAAAAAATDGKGCCDNCECCKGKKDTATV